MKDLIAQIGTFDVENFGDLLFPEILGYYLDEYKIDIFSPAGNCSKPFSRNQFVYAIEDLEKKCLQNHYKAIIIGGGDLLRTDAPVSSLYNQESSLLFKMWALPILIGYHYNIPVLFNALGVPFQFENNMKGIVKELLQLTDYISVRDTISADILRDCGITKINVVPDTVLSIRNLYSQTHLYECRCKLKLRMELPEDGEYIVIQHNCCNINDKSYLKYYYELIQLITDYGKSIVFMPIGYVHNDLDFLQKLYSEKERNQFLITSKLTPEEMCAILAGSVGYIGTSLHGAVVSYSYEKFALCVNTTRYTKISGLLEQIDHIDWEINNISELVPKFKTVYGEKTTFDNNIEEKIFKHFDDIKKRIESSYSTKSMPDLLGKFYNLADYIKELPSTVCNSAKVYFDYGDGFFDEGAKNVTYIKRDNTDLFFEMDIPQDVCNIRIDPIENALIKLEFLNIEIDGEIIVPEIPNIIKVRDLSYIVNKDPSFILAIKGNYHLKCTLRMQILNLTNIQEVIGCLNYEKLIQEKVYLEKVDAYNNALEDIKALCEQVDTLKSQADTLNSEVDSLNSEVDSLNSEVTSLNSQVDSLNTLNLQLRNNLNDKENEIEMIRQSFCWRVLAPVRWSCDIVYSLMQKTYFTQCAIEAIKILIKKGPKELNLAFGRFLKRNHDSKEAGNITMPKSSNNKDGYLAYDAEYQNNQIFSGSPSVKMLAFYLPQYHTFKENDEWWGKGFTEWVNVKNGESRFDGHYQPRVPHEDIGYYSLEDISVLKKQAELAKEHGIYGFCFYYYWFSGKRLMEKPVDMLLKSPEIDLPFCLCWANENWTRAWDGQNKNVLIAQEYSDQDDEQFMLDLKKYIDDARYIRINGKPLIMVYNPGQIPDCHKSFRKWRECAKRIGVGEILIWTCQTANNTAELLNITDCIDAEVEFPPHNKWLESIAVRDIDLHGKSAFIYNYQCLVEYEIDKLKHENSCKVPLHHGCMLAWDNAARRKDAWFTYYAFSLKSLYKWVLAITNKAKNDFPEEERFVFINAWNEWGEGTYLEPDEKYGYANINTVSKALFELPFNNDLHVLDKDSYQAEPSKFESTIAIQIHMFYVETLLETIESINYIPYTFDCFISTDTKEKKSIIEKAFKENCRCRYFEIRVFENRGRDVAPFIEQMSPVIDRYDYICHIHSKKTKTGEYGNEWRKYIFKNLFGNQDYLEALFGLFEKNDKIGIIMPETFPVLELQAEWGGNLEGVKSLLQRISCMRELPQVPIFPVGNMFWARTKAVRPMFINGISQLDFPEEKGQTNATIAHQIERSWIYVAESQGFTYQKVFNNMTYVEKCPKKRRLGIFVHFDANNIISKEDIETVRIFSTIISDFIFVTNNSSLPKEEVNKIEKYVSRIVKRKNIGLDFGAWKDVLLTVGRGVVEQYDELVLFNNSCLAPIFDMNTVFAEMEKRDVDFWGNTVFPYSSNGEYIHRKFIPEHLQSYFTVYRKSVISNDVFWDFWINMPEYENYIDVVANCETQFTKILSDAGFRYEPYILESYYICQYLQNYSVPYEKPSSLVLLHDPFIKKKCVEYMDDEEQIKLRNLVMKIKKNVLFTKI